MAILHVTIRWILSFAVGLAVLLAARTFVPSSIARGASNDSRVYLPFVAGGTVSGGPIATPAVVPASTATPTSSFPYPVVFTSRQILPGGSDYMAAAMNLAGVGAHSRFRVAAPGKLIIRNPDGSLHVLIDGSNPTPASLNLIDVSAPAVSYDGTMILFAGVPVGTVDPPEDGEPGAWRIYEINVDGSNLHQVTGHRPTLDCSQFGSMSWICNTYDDTDPAWLPDGRIVFSSTRWPETAEYSGTRSTNLYVMNEDGTNIHRITSDKNGADRPIVDPLTGKIVYARWWRNAHEGVDDMSTIYHNNDPSQGYDQFNGLTIVPANSAGGDSNLNTNFWEATSINPDGTGLQAWRMDYRGYDANQYYGGSFTPSGGLFGNFMPMFNISEASGFGGIRRLERGFSFWTGVAGVTTAARMDFVVTNPASQAIFRSPYFVDPDVAPNGQLVVSMAPDTNQDYGLYVMNQDGSGLSLLYVNSGTAETRARVIQARPVPPIIPDTVTAVAPLLPPPPGGPYDAGGTFTFQDLNVYFNAPVDAPIVSAPPAGSASTIRYFINQQGTSIASLPQTDWPTLLATGSVTPDGSLINTQAPADVPLFEQIHSANGVTIPLTHQPGGVSGAAHVAGLNFGRPGTTVQCVGCHAGHSLIPIPANPQFTNLAPGATVTVSSTADPSTNGGLIDRQVMNGSIFQYWRSAPGQTSGQWVQLTFPVPVTVQSVVLYNPRFEDAAVNDQSTLQIQGTTVQLFSDYADTQLAASQSTGPLGVMPGTAVPFNNVLTRSVRVNINGATGTFNGQAEVSLAEIEVIARAEAGP